MFFYTHKRRRDPRRYGVRSEPVDRIVATFHGHFAPTREIEDEVSLSGGGKRGAPHETQGLLGGVVAVQLLTLRRRRDAPHRRYLCAGNQAVYEVVVEGVSPALARPEQSLVGVGPRKLGQRRD
jgi:hypothetical protein